LQLYAQTRFVSTDNSLGIRRQPLDSFFPMR
jgi:hypothetical protein